ncbi:MAG: aspartate 1-decarboxylase [Rhodomicrobium sp.]
MRSFFRAKIHRATVTQADLNYEGSLSIDRDLMDAADIAEFEEVHVWNVTRGTRLSTYAIQAERGSGVICVNGAAAHLVHVGDLIIISTYHLVARAEDAPPPVVVRVDENNRIAGTHPEIAGPNMAAKP